ncbi:MAG: hypothetical protein Q9M19_01360 [Mariprofundaceae bacterium]|nr:hypothetical protein [Mariprofundaceae bacterium]
MKITQYLSAIFMIIIFFTLVGLTTFDDDHRKEIYMQAAGCDCSTCQVLEKRIKGK